jgi:hypothetical protein
MVKYLTASGGSKVAVKTRGSPASRSSTVTVNKEVDNAVFSIRLISLGRLVISGLSFMSTKHHFDVNIKSINIINSTFTEKTS